jgi:cytidine deaminase
MKLDQKLVDAAIAQALTRFPNDSAGAAAIYTSDGQMFTSVGFDSPNDAANLCHEAGAYCEAFRLNLQVTASVCVSRESADAPFIILAPCGSCQERLATWGRDVEVGVPAPGDSTKWEGKRLRDVQPYYWRNAFEKS